MENNTVHQLSQALNELLEAYDKLKNENKQITVRNADLEDRIKELEEKNEDLEATINKLSNTTEKNTNELDGLLGRIKDRLTPTSSKEPEVHQEEVPVEIDNSVVEEIKVSEPTLLDEQPTTPTNTNEQQNDENKENKEIDLGRMQSLLNGFNN